MGNIPNTEDRLNRLKNRIIYLKQISRDAAFTEYLRHMQSRVADHERQIDVLAAELERRVLMYENTLQAQNRAMAQQMIQPVPQSMPQQMFQTVPQPMPQQMIQPVPQPMPQQVFQSAPPARQRRSAEFTIGAAVLSIVGGIFVLTAMVLLGMYFMEGLMKGMLLYAACLIVMILSEVLLYRRWPRLGMTLSAIGAGGLYISTLINYLVLYNINYWAALGLNLVITLTVVLLSRKRDAAVYRILGMVAMYASLLIVPEAEKRMLYTGITQIQYLTVIATIFIINMMCLLVPVKKAHTGIYVTHMSLNTTFVFIAYHLWVQGGSNWSWMVGEPWQHFLFVVLSMLVMQLIFVAQVRWRERQTPGSTMGSNVGICITYGISSLFYAVLVGETVYDVTMPLPFLSGEYAELAYRLICSAAVAVICLIPILALRKRQEKWFSWYLFNLLVFVIFVTGAEKQEICICVLVLLVLAKLFSFTKRQMVCNGDAVVTMAACLVVLLFRDETCVIPLMAGLVLSAFCVNYWHVYFETILTYTLALYTSSHMLPALKLPVFVGILFVGMLLYNNVKRWHGREMIVYNILMLLGQGVCYLLLLNPVYRNSYLTYLCALIFGVTTLVICLQENYHMGCKAKPLIVAIFLTYMGLITRTSYPIVNSILLMLLALACVGMGFVIKKKSLRIYGLVLSLVICVKLILYDFIGVNVLQKTILFFVVGVLALMIAAIYMILEWHQEKRSLPQ